ncbi:sensor histidine kinase [Bacillus pinisoli]|uniref:sensor histidine kinase n=1 Tax=Bacillus pinisoli TaxID=2901866 RepID=UPI001FF5AA54|nr:HAMP domain-containing sensor histidine kinase [Bacillus pinisoli]
MNFEYINYNVIDNLFYILVSVFIFFSIFENIKKFHHYKKVVITICMAVPIMLTMKYPIYIDEYCVHDLRQIPFLLGALYGGWPVGGALLIVLLAFRFFVYGFNFLTLIVYIITFLMVLLFSKKFRSLSRKERLLYTPIFTLIVGLITTFISVGISDFFVVTQAYVFYFIVLPPVLMVFVIYIIELLREAVSIKSNMVKLEKMEVVSQLAASISHEVRNPLTVAKGFVQLLDRTQTSEEKRLEYLKHIEREINHAEAIITNYLAFAKPVDEKIESISVKKEMNSLLETLTPLANMNSIKISSDFMDASVQGNREYFHQCLLNILKNAMEAMPNGGELRVRSFILKENIVIEVKDTGVGMDSEQITRFGEPYYTNKSKGTGLGSMVVLKTVQSMNGTIKLTSAINEGTTVKITLPIM